MESPGRRVRVAAALRVRRGRERALVGVAAALLCTGRSGGDMTPYVPSVVCQLNLTNTRGWC